jgi:hypothetical protein
VLAQRRKDLSDAHNVLLATIGKHEAFVPAEVVGTLHAIARTVRMELSNIDHHPHFVGTWWEEGAKNSGEVQRLCDILLQQVKTRSLELRSEQEEDGR